MNSLISKSLSLLRQYKLGIFSIILNRLFPGKFSYQNLVMYYYDLQKEISETFAANKSVKVKKVQDPEDELFKQFCKKYPAQEFVSRIKKEKETAYIATKKGEIVAYAWVTEKELFIKAINYTYPLNNDEIFLYSCFVSRENRGEGIHLTMLYKRLKDYSKNSRYKTAYIGVVSANKGSIKGIEKAGFKEFNRIRYLKLLNKEKWWGLEQRAPTKNLASSCPPAGGSDL